MTIRDWRVRIEDMVEAIQRIRRYTAGLDRDAFIADERTVDAVVRNLEIIGEAAGRLPPAIQRRRPDIPWSRMADMRNILIHEYHAVDAGLIWDTATAELPPLAGPLKAMLREESGAPA